MPPLILICMPLPTLVLLCTALVLLPAFAGLADLIHLKNLEEVYIWIQWYFKGLNMSPTLMAMAFPSMPKKLMIRTSIWSDYFFLLLGSFLGRKRLLVYEIDCWLPLFGCIYREIMVNSRVMLAMQMINCRQKGWGAQGWIIICLVAILCQTFELGEVWLVMTIWAAHVA